MAMKYRIRRPVDGITINEQWEYLREDDKILEYDTRLEAELYLAVFIPDWKDSSIEIVKEDI